MASSTERKVTSHNEKSKKLPIHIKLVVGAIAGAVGTSCIFPIDMIKTRLQSAGKYDGPIDCLKKIYTTEGGIRAFYKGLSANLIGVIPEKAIKLVRAIGITLLYNLYIELSRIHLIISLGPRLYRQRMKHCVSCSRKKTARLSCSMRLYLEQELDLCRFIIPNCASFANFFAYN